MFNCTDCKCFNIESYFNNNKKKKVSFCTEKEKFDFDVCSNFSYKFYREYEFCSKKIALEYIESAILKLNQIKDNMHALQHYIKEHCKDDNDRGVKEG